MIKPLFGAIFILLAGQANARVKEQPTKNFVEEKQLPTFVEEHQLPIQSLSDYVVEEKH